jgi:hypothetical protein
MTTRRLVRGCGTRQPGGAYLVTALGEKGTPLENLILDPPVRVEAGPLGLATVGMVLARDRDDHALVLDWVGAEHYPNVADFVEEVALFGSSRRVPTTFDFATLGPGAQHLLVHPRAFVENRDFLIRHGVISEGEERSFLTRARRRQGGGFCPFEGGAHDPDMAERLRRPLYLGMCATYWWELLLPSTLGYAPDVEGFEAQVNRERPTTRKMPSFEYEGYSLPEGDIWQPAFQPAAFLRMPISRIEVVRDPGDLGHEITLSRAAKAGIPVLEVDE